MMRYLRIFALVILLIPAGGTKAQESDGRLLNVVSNYGEALVYADTGYVGLVKDSPFLIDSSAMTVNVRPPLDLNWTIQSIEHEIDSGLDTLEVDATFDYHYSIQSMPFGSSVYEVDEIGNRQYLGSTPTIIRSELPISVLSVEHQLHGSQELKFDSLSVWNRRFVTLQLPTATEGNLVGASFIAEQRAKKKQEVDRFRCFRNGCGCWRASGTLQI